MSKMKGKPPPAQPDESVKSKQDRLVLVRDHTVRFSAFQTLSAEDFHNLIFDHLRDLRCVQVLDGKTCDVTFCSVDMVKKVTSSITLTLGECEFLVYPVDKPRQIVRITGLPFEISQHDVTSVLSRFGEVFHAERTQYKDRPYDNGDRVYLMHLTANIPRYIEILGFEGKVFHRKQSISCSYCHMDGHVRQQCTDLICRVCGRSGHFSFSCPSRKCKRCHGDGHWARECPVPPPAEQTPKVMKPKPGVFKSPAKSLPKQSPRAPDKIPLKPASSQPAKQVPLSSDCVPLKPPSSWADLSASLPVNTDPFSDSYEQPMTTDEGTMSPEAIIALHHECGMPSPSDLSNVSASNIAFLKSMLEKKKRFGT